MIPGNIDLTENLDFRKVVQQQIPQLPAVWDKKQLSTFNTGNFSLSSTTSSGTTFNVTYHNYTTNESFTTYNNSLTTYYEDETSFTYSWNTIRTYTASELRRYRRDNMYLYQDSGDTYLYEDDVYDNYYSYSPNLKWAYTSKQTKDEYDVFGNKKVVEKEIPKIPWSMSKLSSNNTIEIPWLSAEHRFNSIKENEEYVPDIPWDDDSVYDNGGWVSLRNKNNSNEISRARNLITWLSDKSKSFIESYFSNKEEDNSSYLTNMNWIRVRDAVIDYY